MNAKSVIEPVATDESAFEAWTLLLRLWLGEETVARVVLDWEAPRSIVPASNPVVCWWSTSIPPR